MFSAKYVCYLILSNLLLVSPQLNLYYTNPVSEIEKNNVLQYNCLRAPVHVNENDNTIEVISYCMNEISSNFIIETVDFHTKLTFYQLAKENITSQQLYLWSAPIDLIEDYQFYLNQLSTENNSSLANKIFHNCTWPRFGPKCQYEFYSSPPPPHSSTYDIIRDFYKTFAYNPISFTCYEHLQCNYRIFSACLDWTQICDGNIDCLNDGIDEEHCWQLEINQCKDDEYRCVNGQCIAQSFHQDGTFSPECFDRSDDGPPLPHRFYGHSCHTSEPSFKCEDIICDKGHSPRLCIFVRRNMLLEAISWNKTNSTSEKCWSASKCLLRFARFISQSCESVEQFCESLCAKNACINIVARSCPDILDIPDIQFTFGHLYLTYKKIIEQNSTTENLWLLYICYSMSYYDVFFHMIPMIKLNNRTCFLYETISWSSTGVDIYFTNQTLLKNLYNKFKRYHLIYNYNSTICNRSHMYQCMNSSKCVSIYRLLDKITDCPYKDDENVTIISNSYVMKQLEKTHFKCQTPNKYIHRFFVNDGDCDCDFNEYYQCEDEALYYNRESFDSSTNISFQTICDGFVELSPKEQNQTDETECQQWPCDNLYTHCDKVWNCLNGADEVNCHLSPLSKCPEDHHQCVSLVTTQLMCLPIEKLNDGKIDCLGATDEILVCRKKYASLQSENFYCTMDDIGTCLLPRYICDGKKNCDNGDDEQFCEKNRTLAPNFGVCREDNSPLRSDVEKVLCNQIKGYVKESVIYFTLDGMKNLIADQMKDTEKTILSSSSNIQVTTNQYQSHCQRGLHLHVWLNHTSTSDTCLCPPSYYGSQCQYQNQRISLTIKFQVFSDSYRTPFIIVILLIDDSNDRIIHSYEQISYLSYIHCRNKFNVYLLYSTRSKNLTKQYYIHIDIYEKISLTYRGSVLLPVTLPFLPVQRSAFLIDIPSVNDKKSNSVNYQCVHGKSIQYSNNPDIPGFCRCDSGWSGRYCTIKFTCNCASGSECLGISANNRSICVCPVHKFGSRCLLTNQICQNNSLCQNGGQCIDSDEYLLPKQNFVCLCRQGFSGDRCEIVGTELILSFDKSIVLPQSIFIHFIEVIIDRFPVRSTTFRTIFFEQDSLIIYWSKRFHLVFIQLDDNNYYLTIKQTIYNQSATVNKTINPSDRCSHIREILNATIVQWNPIRRMKYYHLPCQNSSLNLSCFYDDDYICLCYNFQEQRLANCFNFTHNVKFDCSGQGVCENNGTCLQDAPECPTRSICMCPPCFYGIRCQFSTNGFGLSLDAILGYYILPNVDLNHQPFIVKMSFALTIIFMIAGLLDSIISIMTFKNKTAREVGCGLYLLSSSITTLLTMIIFGLKFFILLFVQMTVITNRSFLFMQCHSIDFLLRTGVYIYQWLNACVATERAYMVVKGVNFSKKKSKRTAKFVIILLVIVIAVSYIHDPIFRRLIDEESNDDVENVKRTWCIVKYGFSLQLYDSILNTFHFFGPFMMNFISTTILIIGKSRQQTTIQNKRLYKEILIEQIKQNKHLLTAPIVLVILALPRLIITFVSKCLKSSNDVWVFLVGYFISFIPLVLTFIVFILPSKFYKKEFRKTVTQFGMIIQRRLHSTP